MEDLIAIDTTKPEDKLAFLDLLVKYDANFKNKYSALTP